MTDDKQGEDMNCGLGVAERDLLLANLDQLPDTSPPREVWQRIDAQARAEGLFAPSRLAERLKWLAGAATAATVAMLALNLTSTTPPIEEGPFPTVPPESTASESFLDLNALKAESRDLERNLRLLPARPAVMKVSTATTIRELEDRIAAIDFRLNDRAVALDREQEQIYWRERVRLMNSLVQLRYAQARRASF